MPQNGEADEGEELVEEAEGMKLHLSDANGKRSSTGAYCHPSSSHTTRYDTPLCPSIPHPRRFRRPPYTSTFLPRLPSASAQAPTPRAAGYKGVYNSSKSTKLPFRAEHKGKGLGTFATKVEAAVAYARALADEEASMGCFRERRSTPKQSSRATASAERPRSEASSSMEVDGAPASPARPMREKRSKPSRYDDLAREAEDAEGRAWRLIIDPKVESALYTNYEGTGYKGVVENGWFGARYEGKMKTHPYTMRAKGNVVRFKTAVEAAVAYARVQAGLPAKLQEDEEQQEEEEDDDDDEEEVEDEEAEEDGEEEDEEDEQSLTDRKLWEGAAAAGWQLKVHHQNHYTYIAPNGRRFSSKRAAESWSDGDGSEAGEAASGGEESPAPKPRRKRKRPSKAAEPEDPDGEEQVGLPSSETDSEARPISADLERARLAWPISCAHPSLPDLSQARYVDESEEEVEETEEGDEEEQKWPQLEEDYSIDISVRAHAGHVATDPHGRQTRGAYVPNKEFEACYDAIVFPSLLLHALHGDTTRLEAARRITNQWLKPDGKALPAPDAVRAEKARSPRVPHAPRVLAWHRRHASVRPPLLGRCATR